jgi:hypothetical protein
MKIEKGTLEFGSKPKLDDNALYLIDFTKIDSVESLILILASVGFSFSPRHPHFDKIKQFLALDNPIAHNQPILPQEKELQLPKLKTL